MRTLPVGKLFLSVLASIAMLASGCQKTFYLMSAPVAPDRPHIVFKTGDTLTGMKVEVKNSRLVGPRVRVDSLKFPIDTIHYAFTSKTRKLVIVDNRINLQIVAGKMNAYGEEEPSILRNATLWNGKPGYVVPVNEIHYIQPETSSLMYPFSMRNMEMLMRSHPAAMAHLAEARKADSYAGVILGSGLLTAGLGLFMTAQGLVNTGPFPSSKEPDKLIYYGLASFVTGAMLLSIPFPYFSWKGKGHRYDAIDAYNKN